MKVRAQPELAATCTYLYSDTDSVFFVAEVAGDDHDNWEDCEADGEELEDPKLGEWIPRIHIVDEGHLLDYGGEGEPEHDVGEECAEKQAKL